MARHLRLAARALRVLVACLVLGLVTAPTPARASTAADSIAWIAGARAAAITTRRADRSTQGAPREDGRPARAVSAAAHATSRAPRARAARRITGARAVVPKERIYLEHSALLC